jgi:hypothetical protein
MIRRKFFRSWTLGFLALGIPVHGAGKSGGAPGDDLDDLKKKVATLEENMKKQLVDTPPNVPIGTILPYGVPIDAAHPPPPNWELCDGRSFQQSDYEDLWLRFRIQEGSTIRGAWGGDGKPNFNFPDLRGRFLRGVDKDKDGNVTSPPRDPLSDNREPSKPNGNTGNNVGSVQEDALQDHSHERAFNPGKVTMHEHDLKADLADGIGAWLYTDGGEHTVDVKEAELTIKGVAATIDGTTVRQIKGETRVKNAYVYWIIRVK